MTARAPVVATAPISHRSMATEYMRNPSALGAVYQQATPEYESETFTTYAPAAPQALNLSALLGGALLVLGAGIVALRRLIAPQEERYALLPMSGVADDELLSLDNLSPLPDSRKEGKRKGRGHSAGQGASCGFGNRGQKSRSGRPTRAGFEGGQTPLYRRTPKYRGRPLGPAHRYGRYDYEMVSLMALNGAEAGSTVTFSVEGGGKINLFKVGGVKEGEVAEVPANVKVQAHAFTNAARAAIEAAGGECIILNKYNKVANGDAETLDDDVEADGQTIAMFAAAGTKSVKVGAYREPNVLSKNLPARKVEQVAQVKALLESSALVFGFEVAGYTVGQLTTLRNTMPGNTKIMVVKNTLFRMAAQGTGFEAADPMTVGMNAWFFVEIDDVQETIKAYQAFLKASGKDKNKGAKGIIGGAMESSLLTPDQVKALESMPTKKELIEKIARLIKQVTTKVAYGVNATPRKLAIAVRMATIDDQEGGEEALAAARALIKGDEAAEE
uniref:Large ribosomal subunit protein uL15/eL18 domain-containing protein n=2 Tax=Eutreptiella gymnastica TaxID=73025 RepID=A0A7S1IS83_9EUGL